MLWFASLLVAPLSFAAGSVLLTPGQSTTVPAHGTEATVVSCMTTPAAAPGAARQSSEGFCFCRAQSVDSYVQVHLLKVTTTMAGERAETELKSYDTQAQCDKAIRNYPACL